jgi:transcriptional regulator with XRE-family HTH domain
MGQNDDMEGNAMKQENQIKAATAYQGITQGELARAIGMTPQNFNKKLKRETFSPDELTAIAAALGASYVTYFEFPDGTKI